MLEASVRKDGETNYIAIQGRIDMSNVASYEEILVNNMTDVKKLVVDLKGLTFIDSTGIGGLVTAIKHAFKENIAFELVNVPEGIDEAFEVIGVYELLNYGSIQ